MSRGVRAKLLCLGGLTAHRQCHRRTAKPTRSLTIAFTAASSKVTKESSLSDHRMDHTGRKLMKTECKLWDYRKDSAACKPLKIRNLVGAIGFEFWGRRSFNNIESAAGTVKQWKTM
jgi:hypothetical protein